MGGIMTKSSKGSLCLCVVLSCVQWKEAGDRKREDILCRKWFQVTDVALSHKLQKLLFQVSPPAHQQQEQSTGKVILTGDGGSGRKWAEQISKLTVETHLGDNGRRGEILSTQTNIS